MKILVLHGSTMGNTQQAARQIADILDAESKNIADIQADDLAQYDLLILGTSTWGAGDLQDDWAAFLPQLDCISLAGKTVAVFGLGDQSIYADTFVNGMADLAQKAEACGAALIGAWPKDGYDFIASRALRNGQFVGLALDVDNQPELTDQRIAAWTARLKQEAEGT